MKNKHIIIIGITIIVIIFLTSLIIFSTMNNVNAYKNFTCNDTGTIFEVPHDLKVRQDNNYYGIRSSIMSTPDGDIVIERQVGDNPYIDDTMEGASQLLNSYDGDNINGVEIHSYSRTAKNETTGEVILVSSNTGDNETVDHIINSIKWGNKSIITNTSTDTPTTVTKDTDKSAYAYTSDGSPLYSQEEVDKYMGEKYGLVDYHIKDNGYIDMDEPGYDDKGNYIEE